MSCITHYALLPKNVDYWDYYILCRCDDRAARTLQRMEYWDGTKSSGTIHHQQINDHQEMIGHKGIKDGSRWVYKTHEELSWELIGSCSERASFDIMEKLVNVLMYLRQRSNPYHRFDHTKQYEFHVELVQSHLNRLYAILHHFFQQGRQHRPVLYAIEVLVKQGFYIASMIRTDDGTISEDLTAPRLCIGLVERQLHRMQSEAMLGNGSHHDPSHHTDGSDPEQQKRRIPRFIRTDLKKDEQNGVSTHPRFCTCAESRMQGCSADSAPMQNRGCRDAGTISVITSVTTNSNYKAAATPLTPTTATTVASKTAAEAAAAFFVLFQSFKNEDQRHFLQQLQLLAFHQDDQPQGTPTETIPVLPAAQTAVSTASSVQASEKQPRSAEAVVQLVERLRGQSYPPEERSKELRAAFLLLNLAEAPDLSLQEIEEAWQHGSDSYWYAGHGDTLHVHDLTNHDSHGRRRILAILAHKRTAERRSRRHLVASETLESGAVSSPSRSLVPLTQEQATTLAHDIAAQGALLDYHWQAHPHLHEDTRWMVVITWEASTGKTFTQSVNSREDWEQERPGYLEVIAGYTEFVQARASAQ